MPTLSVAPPFADYDEATFWPRLAWPEVARRAGDPRTVVVVPIAGWAERAGLPLDAEERVLLSVLHAAAASRPSNLPLLVVPALQFLIGPPDRAAFAVDPALAHAQIAEVTASIAAAGFRRVAYFNASPWNESLCDTAARDLRLSLGIQTFCLHLSGLGFEMRSPDEAAIGALQRFIAQEDTERLHHTAERVVRLLAEISARAPLRDDGRLSVLSAP